MKIEGNRLTQDTQATEQSQRTAADRGVKRSGNDKTQTTSTDRVEMSADAQLMTSALNASQKTPAVRTELVERLREKFNAGEIGNDSGRLADRMIDDLLAK
jgi:flagellar biosynthesis anti-sigma factor FlgM